VTIYLLEADRFREKTDVYTYTAEDEERAEWQQSGTGHYDYFAMNILLQKGALELMILLNERPDVIHCHDGHTAVVPAMIYECAGLRSYFRQTGCLVTVHNAGIGYHQEVADLPFAYAVTGLPWQFIESNCLAAAFDPFLAAGHPGEDWDRDADRAPGDPACRRRAGSDAVCGERARGSPPTRHMSSRRTKAACGSADGSRYRMLCCRSCTE
jgi:hypothetical protein